MTLLVLDSRSPECPGQHKQIDDGRSKADRSLAARCSWSHEHSGNIDVDLALHPSIVAVRTLMSLISLLLCIQTLSPIRKALTQANTAIAVFIPFRSGRIKF